MRARKKQRHPYLVPAIAAVALLLLLVVFFFPIPLYPQVGVVHVRGELLIDGEDSYLSSSVGVRETIAFLEEADADPEVAAILLDINSGGGSIVASKELMRAVRNTEKPVVAYINEVGASGAYYVASAADEVIADDDSLTGSIGAISEVHNYLGLLEKIGVNVSLVASGDYKTMASPFDEFTPEEEAMLLTIVEEAHAQFRADLLANRPGMNPTDFDSIADGRLMSGRQALTYGLLDYTGSRDFALGRAAALGGIEGEPDEKVFFYDEFSFTDLFGSMGRAFGDGLLQSTDTKVALK
ncbi:signal peptide peptidase SppA [archaeon]